MPMYAVRKKDGQKNFGLMAEISKLDYVFIRDEAICRGYGYATKKLGYAYETGKRHGVLLIAQKEILEYKSFGLKCGIGLQVLD